MWRRSTARRRRSRRIRARRRTRTLLAVLADSYNKLELPQLRDDAQRIPETDVPESNT
jgi:hypothetical protein